MSVAEACISIVPDVCALNMHLCTEVPAKGITTKKVKTMNSDSSCFSQTESEPADKVACVLMLNYILGAQIVAFRMPNLPLKLH